MTADEAARKAGAVITLWQMAVPVRTIARRFRLPTAMVREIIDRHQAAKK